jgi:methyl-accepting chemotaxis protein
MTFRRNAPAVLIAAVVIVVTALTFLSARLFSGLTASVEESQFQLMQSILDTAIRNAADEALARADIIASLPVTRQAVAARDRERLLAEFSEMFAAQRQRRGIEQAQFHLPPAVSLLRLHNPATHGDDLSRFRPMVVAANREQAAKKGLAIARRGPAILGVAPIFDAQGKFLGTFEFGLEFGPMLDRLKADYGIELTLFIEEKPLREFARGVDQAALSDQNRVGRFIRFHTTNGALIKELATDSDISTVNAPVRYAREAQGLPYGVLLVPLRDNAGEPIGVIAAARDFSGSRAAAGRSLIWQNALAIFAIVILGGFIIVVIRGHLLRPLAIVTDRFESSLAGEPTKPLDGTEKFCAEIQSLADLHERVRRIQAGRGA